MRHHLSIDIETKSSVDIQKAGMYKYAQSSDFEVLLFAYKWDEAPVELVDLTEGEQIPEWVRSELTNPNTIKHAYNAAFEWYCLNRAEYKTPLEQWRCTMMHGLYCGYTAGLDATGKAIGLPQDKRKLTTGKALIRYFCVPCKPTKSNGNRTWNLPKHAPEKWALFKDYCKQDVVTEHEILKRLEQYPVPEAEELLWQMDIRMNAFGVRVDEELIDGALAIDELCTEELTNDAVRITDLQNPNSPAQLKAWIETKISGEISGLTKENVAELLARNDISDEVRKVLEIRQQLGKTSIKKYVAMKTAKGEGDRVRGLTQFYGANRTGRWAGRLVQMPIFTGPQGIGKSTFLRILGKDWFSDSLTSFEGKEAAELIQGTWINEVGELTAMTKQETNAVKQFLSKTDDIYRAAYGRRTNKYPRRCVFFGTSNEEEFLKDMTGNRRFWPVDVGVHPAKKSVWQELPREVDQIWAEAYSYWLLGEPLYMSKEEEQLAEEMQESHREASGKEGLIRAFLEQPIPPNWDSLSLSLKRQFLSGSLRLPEGTELMERDKVCAMEVWAECFNGDVKYMKKTDSMEINGILASLKGWKRNKSVRRYGVYGTQKGFERV